MIVFAIGGDAWEIDELDQNATVAAALNFAGYVKADVGSPLTGHADRYSDPGTLHQPSLGQICPNVKRKIGRGLGP